MHTFIDAHRERFADRFLGRVGAERNDGDFAATMLFVELQRRFDGPLVKVADVVLDAGVGH